MSEVLATRPALPGEAPTVEGRIADIMETAVVRIDEYRLSDHDRAIVVQALRTKSLISKPQYWKHDEFGRPYYFELTNDVIKLGFHSIHHPHEWNYKEIKL